MDTSNQVLKKCVAEFVKFVLRKYEDEGGAKYGLIDSEGWKIEDKLNLFENN